MNSSDSERQELERAIKLLGRSTRPGRLLEYLGAKHFLQQEEQLTEYNIATEVFGRSSKTFDATQDAVVRVEAHRLRKKLRDIYENDSRPEGIRIVLPAGTYAPQFVTGPKPSVAEPAVGAVDEPMANAEPARPRRFPSWAIYLCAIVVLVTAVTLGVFMRDDPPEQRAAAGDSAPAPPVASPAPPGAVTELHVMAGYSGGEVIDSSGVRWTPDRYYSSGGRWSRDGGFIRGTSRPFLFTTWRTGEFGYDIPVVPGSYEMRLFFVSPHRVGDEKLSGFNVSLHGKPLLESFDIVMSANGADIADEQVFRDITPDEKGFIRLWFSNLAGSPLLNALELTPGTAGKLKPIRILMQATSFVDHQGQRWRADDYYLNGFRSTERRKVSGTNDPELFGSERFGHFSYAIPVDRRGTYTVVLHFAEFYFGPQLPGGGGEGNRVFHVYANGQVMLKDFDIYKEGGSLRVVSKKFTGVKPSAQGKINLDFEPVINNATVSGIEVLDESE